MTEFPDQNHPGRVVARGNKEEMRARLATIVAKLGTADPNRVASQLALIINGAYATGLIAEPADLRGDLVDAALKLLVSLSVLSFIFSMLLSICESLFSILPPFF